MDNLSFFMKINNFNISSTKTLTILLIILLSEIFLGLGSVVLPSYIPLIGMLLGIIFLVLCIRIRIGLYILAIAVPLIIGQFVFFAENAPVTMIRTNSSFHFSLIFLILFVLAWIVRTGSGLEDNAKSTMPINKPISNPILIVLILIISWNALSLLWTPNFIIGFIHLVKLSANLCIFYLFYYFIDSSDVINRVGWTYLLVGIFLAILSFYSVNGIDFPAKFTKEFKENKVSAEMFHYEKKISEKIYFVSQWKVHRHRGTAFNHPADLGLLMNFFIAIGAGLLLSTKKQERKKRVILIVILILLSSSAFTTLARAASVSLFILILFLLLFAYKVRKKIIRNSLLILIVFAILFVIVQNEQFMDVALQRMSATGQESSWTERIRYWTVGYNNFAHTPVTGLGIGASYYYLRPYPHMHNIYLSVLFDMGLVGVLLFCSLILMIVKEALPAIIYQKNNYYHYMTVASFGAVLALAAQGLLDFHYNYSVLWLILGFSMSISRQANLFFALKQKQQTSRSKDL